MYCLIVYCLSFALFDFDGVGRRRKAGDALVSFNRAPEEIARVSMQSGYGRVDFWRQAVTCENVRRPVPSGDGLVLVSFGSWAFGR